MFRFLPMVLFVKNFTGFAVDNIPGVPCMFCKSTSTHAPFYCTCMCPSCALTGTVWVTASHSHCTWCWQEMGSLRWLRRFLLVFLGLKDTCMLYGSRIFWILSESPCLCVRYDNSGYIAGRVSEHRTHIVDGNVSGSALQNTVGTLVMLSTGTPVKFLTKRTIQRKGNV